MSVSFVSGNLFKYPDLFAYGHGCNCLGAMGKGIALDFQIRFPEMYKEYKRRCKEGEFNLGDIYVYYQHPYTVYNLASQQSWKSVANLAAIRESLEKMIKHAQKNGVNRIGLPRIGAGLGRLPWNEVKQAIIDVCEPSNVEIVVFEEFSAS